MRIHLVRNAGLASAIDYCVHLNVDAGAEIVQVRLGLLPGPDVPATPGFKMGEVEYRTISEKWFVFRDLKNNRGWSDRQTFMTGYRWSDRRMLDPMPLFVYTLPTRFTAAEASGHAWNGNFMVGFNVPFADSTFDECFMTVNLHPTLGGCTVDGVPSANIVNSEYQSAGPVREMEFPDLRVTAPASAVAGEPVTFSVQMTDGLGDPIAHDAEVYFETVNGFLPVTRRRTQGGKAVATVLTAGMQAGDTVRLKAGFKFYPACGEAKVTLA